MAGRIWIISEPYYPDEGATGFVLTQLAEALAQRMTVNVLCAPTPLGASRQPAPRRETHQGVSIQRLRVPVFDPERLWLRLVNSCVLSAGLGYAAWRAIRPGDLLLAVTNPPMLPLAAAVVCRLRGVRGILLIHDLYPDVLVAVGVLRPGSWPVRALARLNGWTYRQYARIVVLGRDMRARVTQVLRHDDPRVVHIPNWAQVEAIQPQARDDSTLLTQLGLTQKFVVQYSGNMGRTHGLADLLNAAQCLSTTADVHFLMIGAGSQRDWLSQAVAQRGATNVTLLPLAPRAELSNSLNACDVAVISLVSGMAGISVPSRLYNLMAAGKPIIAVTDRDSELARVVLEERIGWVVPPGQPERLAQTILEARDDSNCRSEMGHRARAAAENTYSLRRVLGAYETLLAGLQPAE